MACNYSSQCVLGGGEGRHHLCICSAIYKWRKGHDDDDDEEHKWGAVAKRVKIDDISCVLVYIV